MTYGHVVKTETFMLEHMDCIIFSEACLLFHRLGQSTWRSQKQESRWFGREDPAVP